jgi:hypothetical protein
VTCKSEVKVAVTDIPMYYVCRQVKAVQKEQDRLQVTQVRSICFFRVCL